MKKLVAGLFSVLFTTGASATLMSLELYQGELTYREEGEIKSVVTSTELNHSSVNITSTGELTTQAYTHRYEDEMGRLISTEEHISTKHSIEPFSYSHTYSEIIPLLSSFSGPDIDQEFHYAFGNLQSDYQSFTPTELGKLPPNDFIDDNHALIELMTRKTNYLIKSEAEGISGQIITSSYRIALNESSSEMDFSNYDSFDELLQTLERAMLDGATLNLSNLLSVTSFENKNYDIDNFSFSSPDTNIYHIESFVYNGSARIISIENTEVPEPATNILLALGLMALVRIRK